MVIRKGKGCDCFQWIPCCLAQHKGPAASPLVGLVGHPAGANYQDPSLSWPLSAIADMLHKPIWLYIYMCVYVYIYIIQYYSKSGCSKGKVSGCAILVQAIRGTSTSKGHASPWFSIFWSRRANALWEQSLRLKSDACDITDRWVYIL